MTSFAHLSLSLLPTPCSLSHSPSPVPCSLFSLKTQLPLFLHHLTLFIICQRIYHFLTPHPISPSLPPFFIASFLLPCSISPLFIPKPIAASLLAHYVAPLFTYFPLTCAFPISCTSLPNVCISTSRLTLFLLLSRLA